MYTRENPTVAANPFIGSQSDGVVLICWDHKFLPAIANEILGDSTTAPQKWKKKRFDLVWVFDWDPSSETYGFKQIPQCLLSGDSRKPIKSKHST